MSETYFSLLGLEPSMALDEGALRAAYFKAQRECHPDAARNEAARHRTIKRSADVNQAYQTLKDPELRLYYLLKLSGVDVLSDAGPKASPALLMESMEWREALMACDTNEERAAFKARIVAQIDAALAEASEVLLQNNQAQAVEAALRLRYLSKLHDDI